MSEVPVVIFGAGAAGCTAGDHGAVVIRPDGHIMWRTTAQPDVAIADLEHFLTAHWRSYWAATPGPTDSGQVAANSSGVSS